MREHPLATSPTSFITHGRLSPASTAAICNGPFTSIPDIASNVPTAQKRGLFTGGVTNVSFSIADVALPDTVSR